MHATRTKVAAQPIQWGTWASEHTKKGTQSSSHTTRGGENSLRYTKKTHALECALEQKEGKQKQKQKQCNTTPCITHGTHRTDGTQHWQQRQWHARESPRINVRLEEDVEDMGRSAASTMRQLISSFLYTAPQHYMPHRWYHHNIFTRGHIHLFYSYTPHFLHPSLITIPIFYTYHSFSHLLFPSLRASYESP